jgi:hypothetical protein
LGRSVPPPDACQLHVRPPTDVRLEVGLCPQPVRVGLPSQESESLVRLFVRQQREELCQVTRQGLPGLRQEAGTGQDLSRV